MQRTFPQAQAHKGYPANWESIKRYVIWSELTVDDGLFAGRAIPEVHAMFIEERFGGEEPRRGPNRAFGRASTLSGASGPNYPHNASNSNSRTQPSQSSADLSPQTLKRSTPQPRRRYLSRALLAFTDRLFGYEKLDTEAKPVKKREEKPPVSSAKREDESSEPSITSLTYGRKEKNTPTGKVVVVQRDIRNVEFPVALSQILATQRLPLNVLAMDLRNLLRDQKKINDTDHYLEHYGLPKSRGIRRVIEGTAPHLFSLQEVDGVWIVELAQAPILRDLEEKIYNAFESETHLHIDHVWEWIRATQESTGQTPAEFLLSFGLTTKKSIRTRVIRMLCLTQLDFSVTERDGLHFVILNHRRSISRVDDDESA